MVLFPNAKINFGLEILRKREDGFHDIDSVFYPIPLSDALEVVPDSQSGKDQWHYSGLSIPGSSSDNLCTRALSLLRERIEIPNLSTFLHKAIPMGAGLGGGSADGSFFIRGLNELFELALSDEEMEGMALSLGSDCPFFIKNLPARAQGRGEILNLVELHLQGKHLVLICPDIHVSTKEAYSVIKPDDSHESPADIVSKPIEQWRGNLRNRFEEYAFEKYPRLAEINEKLYNAGALYASMTGSGSAIYGIFEEAVERSLLSEFDSVFISEL
ncbi:4-(cytidine 5'-diphospho)-2-C-methyl-D-erythritol kinase [Cryomorphaceae bacterium 1068]|nr:4-(cytidine 5'-diphospho)-2-C-methyl-D-erythritol kinase [Cryomorphaceae bacterium 1068]